MTIHALPVTNWRNIPSIARDFADRVEAGDFGEVTRAMVVLDTEHGIHTLSWGEEATSLYAMGMFQAASNMAFADGLE
jgi:hypothetical protein